MSNRRINELIDKYPGYFEYLKDYEGPMMPICFGIGCGDGWYSLLDNLMGDIQTYCKDNNKPLPQVDQIKEKFGGLRFYISGGDDVVQNMIRKAENLSYETCETCGTTEDTFHTKGWIKTICKNCHEQVEKK